MKRLSDYKDEEALDLWADLLESIITIFTDPEVAKVTGLGQPPLVIAKKLIDTHKKEVVDILIRIDPTPVDGFNLIIRLLDIIKEIEESPEIMGFLGFAAEIEPQKSSGSVTENTKEKER